VWIKQGLQSSETVVDAGVRLRSVFFPAENGEITQKGGEIMALHAYCAVVRLLIALYGC